MFAAAYTAADEGAAGADYLDDANQLAQLAQDLPAHICDHVLQQVTDEIASATAELNAQVDGTRQLLLQSAALRRSTVLAPLLKQRLVARAVQLQRRRAVLVQHLQRQVRQWRTASAAASDKALHETWSTVQAAFHADESGAHLVQAPLCPPVAALRAFLREATAEPRCLHRRVADQLAGAAQRHSPAASHIGGAGRAADPAAAAAGAATSEDAIEAALYLLLRYTTQATKTAAAAATAAGRRRGTAQATGKAASSPPLPLGAGAGDVAAACDVDVYSEDLEDGEASLAAEEDAASARGSPLPPPAPPSSLNTPSPAEGEPVTAWLRVPGIVSLEQYCAELPWVAELAVQRYAEARERKKRSSSGAGEVGYVSRHVQPGETAADGGGGGRGEAGGRSVRFDGCGMEATPIALHMLAPLGYLFAPALAVGGGGSGAASAAGASPAESAVARALRHGGGVAAATATSSSTPAEPRTGPASAQEEERALVARLVVRGVTAAVDAAWQRVEEDVVAPFCIEQQQLRRRAVQRVPTAGEGHGENEAAEAAEQEAVLGLVEVLRVRYAVELASQVLAARHATELVLDSEDAVIFAETRLVSLLVGGEIDHEEGGTAAPSSSAAPIAKAHEGHPTRQHQRAAAPSASVLTFTVLSLPGVEEIFYVLAYCTGASLLREVGAATAAASAAAARSISGGGSSRPGHAEPFVIDVDAEVEEEHKEGEDDEDVVEVSRSRAPHTGGGVGSDVSLQQSGFRRPESSRPTSGVSTPVGVQWANEEDPAAWQQAALQTWAMSFEKLHLQPRFSISAAHSPRPLASYYRLWLYLWEYVLDVAAPEGGAQHSQLQRRTMPPRGQRRRSGPAQVCVAARTARRWVEKAISAALQRGGVEAGLILYSGQAPSRGGGGASGGAAPAASHQDAVARLQAYLAPEQASQMVRATALQARQALLHVYGIEGAH